MWIIGVIIGILCLSIGCDIIFSALKSAFIQLFGWLKRDNAFRISPCSWFDERHLPFPKILIIVLLLAFILNMTAIWWGLPGIEGWAADEINAYSVYEAIQKDFADGWYTVYPPLHYYILSITHTPFIILEQYDIVSIENPAIHNFLYYLARFISVLMGTAIVFLIYICGCEISDKKTGIISALIASIFIPMVYYSKTANTDVPYLFWFLLSLCYYLRILKHHRLRDYLMLSLTAACAICTKDQAVGLYILMPVSIVISHYLSRKEKHKKANIIHSIVNKNSMQAFFLFVIIFLIINNVLYNMEGFQKHLNWIIGPAREGYQEYYHTFRAHTALFMQSFRNLRFSFGWPMFSVVIIGFITTIWSFRKNKLFIYLLIPGLSYYITFVSMVLYSYVRHMMPIGLILTLFAGKFIAVFLKREKSYYKVKVLILTLILIYTLWYAASLNILMVNDSRYVVERWMQKRIPADALIGLVGHGFDLPRITGYKNRFYFYGYTVSPTVDYLLVNATRLKSWSPSIYDGLNTGTMGYDLIFRYYKHPGLSLISSEDMYDGDIRVIQTNFDKINPEIHVYRRRL